MYFSIITYKWTGLSKYIAVSISLKHIHLSIKSCQRALQLTTEIFIAYRNVLSRPLCSKRYFPRQHLQQLETRLKISTILQLYFITMYLNIATIKIGGI